MDSSGNRAIVALLAIVVVLAGLVYLFGYPLLITVAVIAALASLVFIVVLSCRRIAGEAVPPGRAGSQGRADGRGLTRRLLPSSQAQGAA